MKRLDKLDWWGIAFFAALLVPMLVMLYRGHGLGDFRRTVLTNQDRTIRMLESIGARDPDGGPGPSR